MAKTAEQLQAELDALQQENEGLKNSSEEYRKKAEQLEAAVKAAKTTGGKVSEPVPGSYNAKWTDASGNEQKQKVEFKDGRLRVILPKIAGLEQQAGMYVASESLLLLANGKDAKPEHVKENPALASLDKAKAAAVLTHFAGIKAGFLK